MKKIGGYRLRTCLALLFLVPFGSGARAWGDREVESQQPPAVAGGGTTTTVDYYGDLMTQRQGDTVLYLIDHVIFHHNGTYIQCDSAKRYDDYRIECFGNVLINKDSTYIYGDRASYDGHTDLASVHSPLLKLVNGEATMWVFNHMDFNTRTNIGTYDEGAVIFLRDNRMESDRGIFNGDSSTVTFVGHVALRNDNYKIRTDSVRYDLNSEVVTFLSKAYIWDKDRDFLTSDQGNYVRGTETYHFTRAAYAMTPDQEFWADTMDYESVMRRVVMRRNIQILDTAQRAIGLGDFGFYNDSLKNGMLTDAPAVILYETEEGRSDVAEPDSVLAPADSVRIESEGSAGDSIPMISTGVAQDSELLPDSVFARADTILFESYPPGRSKPRPVAPGGDSAALAPADSLSGGGIVADSAALASALGVPGVDSVARGVDSLAMVEAVDSMRVDSVRIDPAPAPKKDSLERIVRGRHNVKLWRSDVQGVADSLTAYTVDSMASFFGRPLIWSASSQLAADRIDLYSRNGELDYAEFIGSPFLTQQVEEADTLFNQASGRLLQAWFRENEMQRTIMTGNVRNNYYMGDEGLPPDKFAVISCASLTIDFEDQEPIHMNWGGKTDWTIYPIDKIPAGTQQRLPGFSWEPERKPRDRYDITRRSVRPSVRRTAEGYALPVFPIEERFEKAYKSLVEGRTWRDRMELLDESRVEKLHGNELLY
ncbi:MAG: hypothetical protein K2G93_00705 [Rikenella sp.]|nr:hypothetical protein [Rikenella sp.]